MNNISNGLLQNGMQTGLVGAPTSARPAPRMSGMDKLKMILLWTGWILCIVAVIMIIVVWISCKNTLDLANQNYLRADVVRNKVLGITKLEIAEYAKAAGVEWDV